jgi:glycosyltransferase involved in cell wall biosynthesis
VQGWKTWRHVLNCGAYKALAVGRPAVLSDWPQMRRYFTQGFIYVKNAPEAIAAGVQQMLDARAMLTTDIIAMRSELEARRRPRFDELAALLSSSWQRGC